MSPRNAAPELPVAAYARAALAEGHAAVAANDLQVALRWLERAHRLVPQDPNVMMSLASACLGHDPARATRLFRNILEKYDVRQAWLGLAAAELSNRPAEAQAALCNALARHAFLPDVSPLANQIADAVGASGWCALAATGRMTVHPGAAPIAIMLDGRPIRGKILPPEWASGHRADVHIGGRPALGSPIQIGTIRRVVGCVESWEGGIRGWAWHPGDPDTPVTLTIVYPSIGRAQTVQAVNETVDVPDTGPLARPRAFCLARRDLIDPNGPIHVRGPHGTDLLGSPVDPSSEQISRIHAARLVGQLYPAQFGALTRPEAGGATRARRNRAAGGGAMASRVSGYGPILLADGPAPIEPTGADGRERAVTVVVPVHDGAQVAAACLDSLLVSIPDRVQVVVVDDGSRDPALIANLDDLVRQRKIKLVRQPRALGFPASANAGIMAAKGCDVVLLNSDTLVPPGWLERMRAAAYSSRDIGTVTPLSNNASILSYPGDGPINPRPDQSTTNGIDRLAQRANKDLLVDIPVGVGFCLYLRRDCLNAVGLLRAEIFAQGYGEENDFCLRARALGWRHVALTGLFIGHHGGASFDAHAGHLRARNAAILERLHPGHDRLLARFAVQDPLAQARRRIDLLRWRTGGRGWRQSVILITHNDGGGVEQRLVQAVGTHASAGRRPIVLRPAKRPNGDPAVAVHDGTAEDYPNLVYSMPQELPALLRLLQSARPVHVEVHHLLDHSQQAIHELVTGLGIQYDVHVHDYAWFCPRVSLVGPYDRYCGEPDVSDCEACVADLGHFLNEDITVAALRARSAGFLAGARQVVTPSEDAGTRIRRHFPDLSTLTVPHEDDAAIQPSAGQSGARILPAARADGRVLVCVVGGIGVHKGYDILLACGRDAERRNLPLEFVVVGNTIDDRRLLATGRIFVTGGFRPDEAEGLIIAQGAKLGFIPSIWPETWCLGLGNIWRAGLPAAAFDIGAPAERIRRTGRGFLLPLGLPPSAINSALVAAASATRPFRGGPGNRPLSSILSTLSNTVIS